MFTEEQLAEILEICNKATKGPWAITQPGINDKSVYIVQDKYLKDDYRQGVCKLVHKPKIEEDAQFIALARTALPQLAEDYRKLLAVAEAARVACGELEGHGLYAISRLWEALTIAGYGGDE